MTPEGEAREIIDRKLVQAGWIVQDLTQLNLSAGLDVMVQPAPSARRTSADGSPACGGKR